MPNRSSLFTRDDTFLGVCEGLGEDLGLNPLLLRLGFALALFFNPVATICAYLTLGLAVAIARWFHPVPASNASELGVVAPAAEARAAGNDRGWIELAEAA